MLFLRHRKGAHIIYPGEVTMNRIINSKVQNTSSIDESFENLYDRFDVKNFKLKDIKISAYTIDSNNDRNVFGNNTSTSEITIETQDQKYYVSNRFVKTLLSQFDLSEKVLRLFDTQTVLNRIIEKEPDASFKVTIDKNYGEGSLLLGTLKENQKILPTNNVLDIIRKDPRLTNIYLDKDHSLIAKLNNDHEFEIPEDSLYHSFIQFNYPIDGIYNPAFELGFERVVCTNGATITDVDYKSNVVISDESGEHLERLLKSFSNESGYQRIKNRLSTAIMTPASLNEIYKIENLIANLLLEKENARQINKIIEDLCGNPLRQYGTTSLKTIPEDIRKATACKLCVLELFNIGTELTTHYSALISNQERFSKVICDMLTKPFDFEGIKHQKFEIRHFYLDDFKPFTKTYTDDSYLDIEGYESEDLFSYGGLC